MSLLGPTLRRALWILAAGLLLLVPQATASEDLLSADFDGDGKRDRVTIDRNQPSVLHVWLSKSGRHEVLRGRAPVVQIMATDLDGDHRPELIAKDRESSVLVWKNYRRRGFRTYRPHVPLHQSAHKPSGEFEHAQRHDSDALPAFPDAPVPEEAGPVVSVGLESSPGLPRVFPAGSPHSPKYVASFASRPPPDPLLA